MRLAEIRAAWRHSLNHVYSMRALPLFLRKEFLHPDNFGNLEQFAYQFATVTTSASSLKKIRKYQFATVTTSASSLKNSEISNLLVPFNFSYLTDEYSFECCKHAERR